MRSVLILIVAMACSTIARSQLCTGSLGDPVALFTFGTGTGQGPALSPDKTNYTYNGTSCPPDGSYTITNTSTACFGQTWHDVTLDHTPSDQNGYFMLFNASYTPGVFYVDTVSSLCGGTTYEFSAYIMNVIKSSACGNNAIEPDLTFTIETTNGTKLVTYNTGKIPSKGSPQWVQYGTFLTTPANVTKLVIRITNNAPGGCGNDLAIDDIMFRPCGPKVEAGIEGVSDQDTTICEPDVNSFKLKMTYSTLYADPRLQWQSSTDNGINWQNIPGATSDTYLRPLSSVGTFKYRALIADGTNIILSACRISSPLITVKVNPKVSASAGPDIRACKLSDVTLGANGGASYAWTGPTGFASNLQNPVIPGIDYPQAGKYIVKVTNAEGCSALDTINVLVLQNAVITLPSSLNVCEATPVTITASGGTRIKWTPSAGLNNDTIFSPVATISSSTRYFAVISNTVGCTDTGSVLVNVFKKALADAGPDIKILKGSSVTLKGIASGTDISYAWSPAQYMSDPGLLNPLVNPPSDIRYRLTVSSNTGCTNTSTDEVEIRVFDFLKVPNTFTPNGDGYNDVWELDQLRAFEKSVTEVYNTAGQLVHRDIGYSRPWDGTRNGKALPAGTYYYVIDLKVDPFPKLSGYLTIIR